MGLNQNLLIINHLPMVKNGHKSVAIYGEESSIQYDNNKWPRK